MRINKKDFIKARVNISIAQGQMLKTIRELQGLSQLELSNISLLETDARQIGCE